MGIAPRSLGQSGELQIPEEKWDQEEHVEAHGSVDDVAVRQLHLHVLPGFPHVGARNPGGPAHGRNGHGFHQRPRGHEHQHAHGVPQHGAAHQPGAEGGHGEGQLVGRGIGQQAQQVVDVGGQGHAGARGQDLGCVAPRGAPGVQGEGEEAHAQVEGHDEQRGVAAAQVVGVDGVQRGQEEQQDEAAVEDAGDDVLHGTETETGEGRSESDLVAVWCTLQKMDVQRISASYTRTHNCTWSLCLTYSGLSIPFGTEVIDQMFPTSSNFPSMPFFFLPSRVVGPTSNPQPGGPGRGTNFGLDSGLSHGIPARLG